MSDIRTLFLLQFVDSPLRIDGSVSSVGVIVQARDLVGGVGLIL